MATTIFTESIISSVWIPETWTVVSRTDENQDTVTLEVKACDQGRVLNAKPGQFNMLYTPGRGEIPVSISSFRFGSLYHTIRRVGANSEALAQLATGELLGLRGPFGSSWPIEESFGKTIYLIAGGLGLAPLRPVIEFVETHREFFQAAHILYGTRDSQHLIFKDDLQAWSKSWLSTRITVDNADPSWSGHVGPLPQLLDKTPLQGKEGVAFICGPEVMMRLTAANLVASGMPAANIYLSMERNMMCAMGFCGHCQFGPAFLCREGPVLRYDKIAVFMRVKQL